MRLLGYCTNVHAGRNWQETRRNLEQYAARIRQALCPQAALPVGLWLSSATLAELTEQKRQRELADVLSQLGLESFTFNGFPYGDFHAERVKHAVYEPAWDQPQRAAYTLSLAQLHAELAPGPCKRSISTLPLGWGSSLSAAADVDAAIANLRSVAGQLAALHDETGVLVHLDIEPEPGCIVETSADVLALFEALLHGADDEAVIRRHLRVCHDICHAAVMYEDQATVLARYRAAGIKVGKVQVSSALRVDLRGKPLRERSAALQALQPFAEDRYLHQTVVAEGGNRSFFDDLPLALEHFAAIDQAGDEWRVHFHLPVFLAQAGAFETTQAMIEQCFQAITPDDDIQQFEVETYTWEILPKQHRSDLVDGIARELTWVSELMQSCALHCTPSASQHQSGGARASQ